MAGLSTNEIIENASILFEDGIIKEIFRDPPAIEGALVINAAQFYISGFIDMHAWRRWL